MMEPVDLTKPLSGVRYERRDHIATITLDRPERGNSLTPGMQLTRDLISPAGVLLLASGTELDKSLINHLLRLERSGPEPLELFVRDMDG